MLLYDVVGNRLVVVCCLSLMWLFVVLIVCAVRWCVALVAAVADAVVCCLLVSCNV